MTLTAPLKDLVLHPQHELVPAMRPEEFIELMEDIKAHGMKVPIEVDADGITVLDGKHRLEAARQLGWDEVPIRLVELRGETANDYVVKAAMLRRQLTDGQRAMLAAYLAKANPEPRGGNRVSGTNQTHPTQVSSKAKGKRRPGLAKAAAAVNSTISQAEKATDLLNSDPDLAKSVHEGTRTLPEARKEAKKRKTAKKVAEAVAELGLGGPRKAETEPSPPQDGDQGLPPALAKLKSRTSLDKLGEQLRIQADILGAGLGRAAEILGQEDVKDLGDNWAWLSVLFVQMSHVTGLLREKHNAQAEDQGVTSPEATQAPVAESLGAAA